MKKNFGPTKKSCFFAVAELSSRQFSAVEALSRNREESRESRNLFLFCVKIPKKIGGNYFNENKDFMEAATILLLVR